MTHCRVLFAALQLAALLFCTASQRVDLTLIDGATGEDVVIATVNKIAESGIFREDFQFLRRMAYVETNDGETATPGDGGIWAVSDNTLLVTKVNLGSPSGEQLEMGIQRAFGIKWSEDIDNLKRMDVPLYSALATMIIINITNSIILDDITQQAIFWKRFFKSAQYYRDITPQFFIEKAETLTVAQCVIKGVDMIFVMDESGSITLENFERMKNMSLDIVDAFEIGPDRTRVGWINFASRARVVFDLDTYHDNTSLQEGIRAIEYGGGGTQIHTGLFALYNMLSTGARNMFDIPEVAIVVTDGQSDINLIQVAAAQMRRDRNVNVFVVGVGAGIRRQQLEAIAEAGIASDILRNIFILEDFNMKDLDRLQDTLRARTCFSATFSNTSIDGVVSTVPEGTRVYVNTVCPPEGLTINACGREGKIILYISKTPNPGPASYDEIIEIEKEECDNTFINCDRQRRRRRQSSGPESDRIYIAIEGVEVNNEYELNATTGDTSTPKVKLYCTRNIENNTLVVDCTFERMLTKVLCSVNNAPFQPCTLPLRIDISSPKIHLQINVTDSLNLTDSATIEYEVGPLVLRCSLSAELEIIECTSNNQLAPNMTVCSFNGVKTDPCTLPHGIDVTGLPAGVYRGLIEATDTFGFSASSIIEYQVVEDRVSDDMVMTVPLDINPLQIGESADTLSLCYQVHGEEGKVYNLLSDDCVSVNAHIGIRAVGNNGTCYDITIERQNCAVSINNQPLQTNTRFEEEGIKIFDESVMRIPTIHISVPNCGKPTIDHMFISCTKYTIRGTSTPTDILQFGSTRGNSQVQPPHGLIGQFWGAFMLVQSHIPDLLTSSRRKQYDITVFPPSITPNVNNMKSFVSTLIPRGWGSQQTPCLYAGDRQGGAVIQGKYSDYEVNVLFGTQYLYSKFDESKC